MPKISIVIPVFNEELCLAPLFDSLDAFIADFGGAVEVLMVDDGSTDDSLRIMGEEALKRAHFRVLALRANTGQTSAMAAGLDQATGDVIVFMDADLQNDPADIPLLLAKLDGGYDLVSGWRKNRQDRAITRTLPSMMANRLIGWVTGVRIHDYGCTLKAYRASVVKPLHLYSDMHRFLPALCASAGARVTEIVVNHRPRTLGQSKYGLDRIFKVLVDLVVIKMIVTFADRPLHYFGLLSLFFLVLTAFTGSIWAWNLGVNWGAGSIILPAVIVLFFCCFLYFLFIGLLADLIVRVQGRGRSDVARAATVEVSG